MNSVPQPIFLLSLPRSGSTLVQRIIGAHPLVATVAEPWVLLPLLSALEPKQVVAKYGHETLVEALLDLCKKLPFGVDDYYEAVRNFALTIYSRLMKDGQCYFLDKTPRYHLVAHRIMECFPHAKIILVWRNPLAVVGSGIHSYGDVWRGHRFRVDLHEGLRNLIDVSQKYRDRIYAVRFEDLVGAPDEIFRKIFEYLELDFRPEFLKDLSAARVQGFMGDKTGISSYRTVSTEPLEKWKYTLANPTRRLWCRRYLRCLGEERLGLMGYNMQELIRQLNEAPMSLRGMGSDLVRMAYSEFIFQFTPGFKDQYGIGTSCALDA